jgi:hypothetical protein
MLGKVTMEGFGLIDVVLNHVHTNFDINEHVEEGLGVNQTKDCHSS